MTTEYTYDSDGRESEVKMGDATRLTDYDELGRVTGQYLNKGNLSLATAYEYPIATGNCEHALPCEMRTGNRIYHYTYDKMAMLLQSSLWKILQELQQ